MAPNSWSVPRGPNAPVFFGGASREGEVTPEQNPNQSCVTGMWSRIQPNVPIASSVDMYNPVFNQIAGMNAAARDLINGSCVHDEGSRDVLR